jgi:pantoate kinase
MKASTLLLFTLCLTACGVARPVLESDNTKVEVKVVEKIVKDTAWFELPVIVEKVATLDTASVLENKYAKSEAVVTGGVLHHSLQTKPVREPVIVESKETVRDSIVYRDRIQTKTVEVEKKLTWWQTLKMKTGGVTLLAIVLIVILFLISHFTNLNLFKL